MNNRELAGLGRTDASSPLICGNQIYDPLVFSPKLVRFNRREYLFLNKYRLGTTLEEAAAESELSPEEAESFLAKRRTRQWLADRARMDHIKNEWAEPSKWWAEGNAVWEGKKVITKTQVKVWEEFGKRVAPTRVEEPSSGPHIEIHINPQAVRDAFVRQNAIEGELT